MSSLNTTITGTALVPARGTAVLARTCLSSPTPVLSDAQFYHYNISPIEINQRSQTTYELSGVADPPVPDLVRKSGTMYDNALDNYEPPNEL